MTKEIKLLVGITENDELYFLEIDPTCDNRNGYPEFSMSGFTVSPITTDEIEARDKEWLEDSGEDMWREAVANGSTREGLDEWMEAVKNEVDSVDTSLFPIAVEVDGQNYQFESESCGQHEEEDIKHYFIPTVLFQYLLTAWRQFHLKDVNSLNEHQQAFLKDLIAKVKDIAEKQDLNALAQEAIKIIKE